MPYGAPRGRDKSAPRFPGRVGFRTRPYQGRERDRDPGREDAEIALS